MIDLCFHMFKCYRSNLFYIFTLTSDHAVYLLALLFLYPYIAICFEPVDDGRYFALSRVSAITRPIGSVSQ
jgi:hypothetical protein